MSSNDKQEFVIREAQVEDIPVMQYINQTCLTENYDLMFWVQYLIKNPKASFVAVNNKGLIVGYVFTCVKDNNAHIFSFAIFSKYRRLGLGERLMKASIDSCFKNYKINDMSLNVRVLNTPAISLYNKLGFNIVFKTEKYYNNGEDAYFMKFIPNK